MNTINYLNMDEGKAVLSTPDEFTEKAINNMSAWLSSAVKSQKFVSLPEPLSEYNALVDKGDDGLVCSIYAPASLIPPDVLSKRGEEVMPEGVPLLIFGVALDEGKSLWNFFTQGFYTGDRVIPMPPEPWVTVMPYQMYRYIPDPGQIVRFQKCVARAWFDVQKKSH
ncbi:hypothetical protein NB640_12755 [Oxalobacter vibrioformis]|uniref:Uncharacterized protein n=1 Tax=Oxalobacter vibrioformis TaxID=933080 RepID=A0A9E9P3C1_9BURK|nr:hypothetical protein [Oxalobacter vibrioformis]NLC23195.1 hypothetical protein [Oxalobacter sp.]WAW10065.1 hypothetical protein NB640_12755 [Oxalobacter vibrioformis]